MSPSSLVLRNPKGTAHMSTLGMEERAEAVQDDAPRRHDPEPDPSAA